MNEGWRDPVCEAISAYAMRYPTTLPKDVTDGVARIVMDTVAVGLGAFTHPAAVIARQYQQFFPADPTGASIWGTSLRVSPDKATLANGVPLRCYDYNDLLVGAASGGHPSDMLAALIAVAEWKDSTGEELASAISVSYDVAAAFYDVVRTDVGGWDHSTVTALGAVCGIAKLMRLSFEQLCEALAIASIQHLQSDEIESSVPNKRGDLTMWKRFHGADAMRHALDSCLLASVGAEGSVRPFIGRLGFLSKFQAAPTAATELITKLVPGALSGSVRHTNLKRWPVGSRAQSAIDSALSAREQMPAGGPIDYVEVQCQVGVYNHLVAIRSDPYRPRSREAADHSLPYIVGSAVLDGHINAATFNLENVLDPVRAQFVADRVRIKADPELGTKQALSKVVIVSQSGQEYVGSLCPARGSYANPFTWVELETKLFDNASSLMGAPQIAQLAETIKNIVGLTTARHLTALLAKDAA